MSKKQLTKRFLEDNESYLFSQIIQWRGHGSIDKTRPRSGGKEGYGVFNIPDNFVIANIGVGEPGVTFCGNEGQMTLEIFRNFESRGTVGAIKLEKVSVNPALFKANDYKHQGENSRICLDWRISTDKDEYYFNGYIRNAYSNRVQYCNINNGHFVLTDALADLNRSTNNIYYNYINPARNDEYDSMTQNIKTRLSILLNNLNKISIIKGLKKTNALYPWTYKKLETYSMNELKILLRNCLKLHFHGWSDDVNSYINGLSKEVLIHKISIYSRRFILLFNCSWIPKSGIEQIYSPSIAGDLPRIEAGYTTAQVTEVIKVARDVYKRHAYIIEKKARSKKYPIYIGPGNFKDLDVEAYNLCVKYMDYKSKNLSGLEESQAHPFAITIQDLSKGIAKGENPDLTKITPQLKRILTSEISDSSSSSNKSSSSQGNSDEKKRKKRRRKQRRKPFSEKRLRTPPPEGWDTSGPQGPGIWETLHKAAETSRGYPEGPPLSPIREGEEPPQEGSKKFKTKKKRLHKIINKKVKKGKKDKKKKNKPKKKNLTKKH